MCRIWIIFSPLDVQLNISTCNGTRSAWSHLASKSIPGIRFYSKSSHYLIWRQYGSVSDCVRPAISREVETFRCQKPLCETKDSWAKNLRSLLSYQKDDSWYTHKTASKARPRKTCTNSRHVSWLRASVVVQGMSRQSGNIPATWSVHWWLVEFQTIWVSRATVVQYM